VWDDGGGGGLASFHPTPITRSGDDGCGGVDNGDDDDYDEGDGGDGVSRVVGYGYGSVYE